MSITSDIRAYADSATASAASAVNEANEYVSKYATTARGSVDDIAGKARGAVTDLRTNAEKALNTGALRTAVEPYFVQVREYGTAVSDRTEQLIAGLRSDKRVARVLDQAESVSGVVIGQVQQRIVTPVRSATGLGAKSGSSRGTQSKPTTRSTAKSTTRPATVKPASGSSTSSSTARKSTARKPAATRKTSPQKQAPKA